MPNRSCHLKEAVCAGTSADGICVVVTHHHAPRVTQTICVMMRHVCARF
jgi:hypothetical protein